MWCVPWRELCYRYYYHYLCLMFLWASFCLVVASLNRTVGSLPHMINPMLCCATLPNRPTLLISFQADTQGAPLEECTEDEWSSNNGAEERMAEKFNELIMNCHNETLTCQQKVKMREWCSPVSHWNSRYPFRIILPCFSTPHLDSLQCLERTYWQRHSLAASDSINYHLFLLLDRKK